MTLTAGTVIVDRYAIERELGRGGMATVWLARDLRHDRRAAIKVLHPELAGAIGVDRFLREVRLTAQLQHPNIIAIFDSGTIAVDGTTLPWFAMPYVEGESLRARLDREGQLPIEDALTIAEAVGAALAAAHLQGIVHRDIKPENIIVSGSHAYVVDFGIAKALSATDETRLTGTGLTIGSPAYMSPEQSTAARVDARSDQYSLATVLYEMLAGEPPFGGPNTQAVFARRLTEPARPLLAVRSTVPVAVEQAVLKALQRLPADRFADVASFTRALRSSSATTPRSRHLLQRGVIAAAVIAVAIVSGSVLWARRPSKHVPDAETLALFQRGVRAYDARTPTGAVEAVAAFNSAIARDSSYGAAWNGLAKAYIRAEEREFAIPGVPRDSLILHAVQAVNRALALDSLDADAWLSRGIVSFRLDPTDYRGALRSINASLGLDSTNAVAWHFLARITAENGDVETAVRHWHRAVSLDPKYLQGLAFLGLGYYWRREYDQAVLWLDSALAIDPSYLLGLTGAGEVAVQAGAYDRAVALYQAARRVSSAIEEANAVAGAAHAEARAGRQARAREALRQADSIASRYVPTPLHTAVYFAHAHAASGNSSGAIESISRYEQQRDLHFQFHLRCDPPLDPLRDLPAFQALLIRPSPPRGAPC